MMFGIEIDGDVESPISYSDHVVDEAHTDDTRKRAEVHSFLLIRDY